MKLKLLLFVALLVVLTACVPSPEAVQTSQAVEVPAALKLALSALILAAVTLGLQVVFDSVGLDLRGIGSVLAVSVSAFAVAQLQGYVDAVPSQYDAVVLMVLNVAVVVLGGLGTLQALLRGGRAAELLPHSSANKPTKVIR